MLEVDDPEAADAVGFLRRYADLRTPSGVDFQRGEDRRGGAYGVALLAVRDVGRVVHFYDCVPGGVDIGEAFGERVDLGEPPDVACARLSAATPLQ